jgi:hypothetical protein
MNNLNGIYIYYISTQYQLYKAYGATAVSWESRLYDFSQALHVYYLQQYFKTTTAKPKHSFTAG